MPWMEDINELNLPKTCDISFSDPDDLLNFKLVICPDEGFYKRKFVFSFTESQVDKGSSGEAAAADDSQKPTLSFLGLGGTRGLEASPYDKLHNLYLQYLFLEPNPEDPLNKEAAEVLQNNRRLFEQNVQRSMRGGYIGSTYFERCLK
ncbi:hypothetical protein STEG23_007033 [Scotinomys teguina]